MSMSANKTQLQLELRRKSIRVKVLPIYSQVQIGAKVFKYFCGIFIFLSSEDLGGICREILDKTEIQQIKISFLLKNQFFVVGVFFFEESFKQQRDIDKE